MDGRTIRALRRRNGWTQADLAARIGTDHVTVSRWERGVTRPRPSAQIKLRELRSPDESDLSSLARVVGHDRAVLSLKRAILLARTPARQRFAEDPTTRVRRVERARREQTALKRRVRFRP